MLRGVGIIVLYMSCFYGFAQELNPMRAAEDSSITEATSGIELTMSLDTNKFSKRLKSFRKTLSQAVGLQPYTPLEKPKIAAVRSVVPGMGQVTNKDYWKLPIIYGAAGAGLYYGILENRSKYLAYRNVRVNLYAMSIGNVSYQGNTFEGSNIYFTVDPTSTRFDIRDATVLVQDSDAAYFTLQATSASQKVKLSEDTEFILVPFTEINDENIRGPFQTSRIESGMNRFRRYRDLSIIGFAAGWLLVAIEANVAAHMDTFEITDDLSIEFQPKPLYGLNGVGLGVDIKLRF